MKGNINMQKQKRITLNADKRKVIADVFQNYFEDNSKFKKAWQDAKDKYVVMRNQAKTIMDKLVVVANFTMIIVSMFQTKCQRL
jgi:hypothetical protein